jgi:putative hydrolase of the HAD superfamily
MVKVVIFDLDNTLTDFRRMKETAVDAAVEAMIDAGLRVPHEEVKRRIYQVYDERGIEFQRVFDIMLENLLGEVDYKIQAAGIVAYRRAREAFLVLYPHVKSTLIELVKRGLKLAVLSDAPRKEAWLRLCYLQLHHIFDYVVTFDDTGVTKPNPEAFRRVLAHFDVKPEETVMVGDWPERDIQGAVRLGIWTVFARYGNTFDVQESGAHFEIDDFAELLDVIDRIDRGELTPRKEPRDE